MIHTLGVDPTLANGAPFSTVRAMSDAWSISQTSVQPEEAGKYETIFAVANGLLGVRGTLDDGRTIYHSGTYVNGFYDTEPIAYGEHAYGYAERRQRMLNITDGSILDLWIDDDPFDLSTGTIEGFERRLDLREGVLRARYRWRSPSGSLVDLATARVVPFSRRSTAAIEWRIVLPEDSATITVISGINSRVKADEAGADPRVGASLTRNALTKPKAELSRETAVLGHTTRNTRFRLVCAMEHAVHTENHWVQTAERQVNDLRHRFVINAEAGIPVRLEKFLAYEHTRDRRRVKLAALAKRAVRNARTVGFAALETEQRDALSQFWHIADVEIDGDAAVQQSIRFNLYHLLQAAGRDGHTNLGAKGLTGEGYEGHYFWDTEIYALPIFTYLVPETARRLVEYRHATLPQARRRARQLHHRGALFPWRTINGEEASAYFPAGTAQYHIDADVTYAARRYALATGDTVFLHRRAAEIAVETARFWVSLGGHVPGRGFCINGVTGPDEYTAMVNNNVFTNLMARDNLLFAAELVERLPHEDPESWIALQTALAEASHGDGAIGEREPRAWRRAGEEMFVPYDYELDLYPQDDSFFHKTEWDFATTPDHHYPLLLHYHPLTLYRHQVLKQPDLVLALFLQGAYFDSHGPSADREDSKRRNFFYYDRLTTGDSSLSACVQSIVAAEIGEIDLAYHYFTKTVRMDIDDINGNVQDGVHTAAMAGTWLSVVFGFGGFRDFGGRLQFAPRLPNGWTGLRFRLRVSGRILAVDVGPEITEYRLIPRDGESGSSLWVYHHGEALLLTEDEAVCVASCPSQEAPVSVQR